MIDRLPDGAFLFVDPPYYNADQKKFYLCHFDQSDHHRLSARLQRHQQRLKFLVTYDDSAEYASFINGWAKQLRNSNGITPSRVLMIEGWPQAGR